MPPVQQIIRRRVVLQSDLAPVDSAPDGLVPAVIERSEDGTLTVLYEPGATAGEIASAVANRPLVVASEAGNPLRTVGANSSAEHDITSLLIPAGALGTVGVAKLETCFDVLQNSGGTINATFRAKLGGTTVLQSTASNFTTATTRRRVRAEIIVANCGSASVQDVTAVMHAAVNGASAVGLGGFSFHHFVGVISNDGVAVDTTAARSLALSIQWASANANASTAVRWAKLTIYP